MTATSILYILTLMLLFIPSLLGFRAILLLPIAILAIFLKIYNIKLINYISHEARNIKIEQLVWIFFLIRGLLNFEYSNNDVIRDYLWISGPWFVYASSKIFHNKLHDNYLLKYDAVILRCAAYYLIALIVVVVISGGNIFYVRNLDIFSASLPFVLLMLDKLPRVPPLQRRQLYAWSIALISMSRLSILSIIPPYVSQKINRRQVYVWMLALFGLAGLIYMLSLYTAAGGIFLLKIINIFDEVTIGQIETPKDAYSYWRSFELISALEYFSSFSLMQIIFGTGFGSRLPLGGEFELGGTLYTDLPVLHNGLSYIFLKSGFIGVILTINFLMSVGNNLDKSLRRSFYIFMFLGAFSITGPYHPQFYLLLFVIPLWGKIIKSEPLTKYP